MCDAMMFTVSVNPLTIWCDYSNIHYSELKLNTLQLLCSCLWMSWFIVNCPPPSPSSSFRRFSSRTHSGGLISVMMESCGTSTIIVRT